ncbi:Arginase/deacetylase [Armillaria solidipes]|uniref:Arginase/deacetylase n=1 Tax=Armillaria solidipes TaxID=1076256 RepID=A0A2H3APN6_9AGAR|nr:Arginase/deacetylase [Armillaria solidipes]
MHDQPLTFLRLPLIHDGGRGTTHCPVVLVGEDNPSPEGVFEFCSISSGGPWLRLVVSPAPLHMHKLGLNARRLVSGFCYIVLGIFEPLRAYPRVLYVDIHCHHVLSSSSLARYGEYFPGTGTQEDKGRGKEKDNVLLKDGITDESSQSIFEPVADKILEVFQCNAAQTLSRETNSYLRKENVPLILLDGGGYTVKNVARTRSYEAASALGIEDTIDPNLPRNEYFEWFGPRYRLEVVASNIEDMHVKDGSLEQVRVNALEHVRELNNTPFVDMHDTPKESLLEHLGFGKENDTQDKLDERLARNSPPLLTATDTYNPKNTQASCTNSK